MYISFLLQFDELGRSEILLTHTKTELKISVVQEDELTFIKQVLAELLRTFDFDRKNTSYEVILSRSGQGFEVDSVSKL